MLPGDKVLAFAIEVLRDLLKRLYQSGPKGRSVVGVLLILTPLLGLTPPLIAPHLTLAGIACVLSSLLPLSADKKGRR